VEGKGSSCGIGLDRLFIIMDDWPGGIIIFHVNNNFTTKNIFAKAVVISPGPFATPPRAR
jgi:hypothetical protein